jgi:hypothetical protein
MKHVAGIGKQTLMDYNWGCAYANGLVVLVEGIDVFRLGTVAFGEKMNPSGN